MSKPKPAYSLYVFTLVMLVFAFAGLQAKSAHGVFDAPASRLLAFAACLVGLAALAAALGKSVCGDACTILKSGRNTYSLSRLQMALWTWLIFSALLTLAASRAWDGHIDTMFDITLNEGLFAVMGISVVSGAATPALLALKDNSSNDAQQSITASQRMNEPIRVENGVVKRPPNRPAKLSDVVRTDDGANAGGIDLSKVQNLVLTVGLVVGYAAMLCHGFWTQFAAHDTQLPKFSLDMAGLLGISHGAYLTYKAVPKPTGDTSEQAIAVAGPPPTPNP